MNIKNFFKEIDSIIERDPAAGSRLGVIFLYPSFHVMLFYKIGNILWRYNLKFLARLIMHFARIFTGIEIHPAAKIGSNFFMDHGLGIVIGETTEIGENVTIYQGVTLGGIMPSVESDLQRNQKRHPTVGNNVIIGSGAQILGAINIGDDARIGANSVVSRDVPANVTVAGVPAREFARSAKKETFKPYAVSDSDADPREKALVSLLKKVENLEKKIKKFESDNKSKNLKK
jgi:serine O-acetyltransferase|tara:strand:- start:2047 stop:2739 length:693 start_codon:yes stop_codon:yes gene_type:complete